MLGMSKRVMGALVLMLIGCAAPAGDGSDALGAEGKAEFVPEATPPVQFLDAGFFYSYQPDGDPQGGELVVGPNQALRDLLTSTPPDPDVWFSGAHLVFHLDSVIEVPFRFGRRDVTDKRIAMSRIHQELVDKGLRGTVGVIDRVEAFVFFTYDGVREYKISASGPGFGLEAAQNYVQLVVPMEK